jgi:hypothetical protein
MKIQIFHHAKKIIIFKKKSSKKKPKYPSKYQNSITNQHKFQTQAKISSSLKKSSYQNKPTTTTT